jgi:hypothetical protein
MEPLGLTEEILNKDPLRYIKTTKEDGSVNISDMYGAYAKTGYHKVARQETLDKMKATLETAKTTQALGEAEVTLKAFNTGSPEEVMKALALTDPELFMKLKQQGSVHMDAYTQAITAFRAGNPNPTPEQWRAFNRAYATKTVAGVGYNAENMDVEDLTSDQNVALSLFTPTSGSRPLTEWKSEAQGIQNKILSNLSSEQQKMVLDADKKLTSNNMTATMVEKLLKAPTTARMERGVIDNILTSASKITGLKNAQALDNVDFNSRSGMIVAEFIKEISGTAAADAEVARLMDVFLGGNLSDETYVKRAMGAFADQLRIKNNEIGKQYKQYLPYTVGTTTNLKPKSQQPAKSVGGNRGTKISNASLPPLVFPGKPALKDFHPNKSGKKPSLDSFGTGAYK